MIGMNHDTLRFPCLIPGAQAPVRVPWGGAPYGTAAGKDSLTDFEKPFQQVFSRSSRPLFDWIFRSPGAFKAKQEKCAARGRCEFMAGVPEGHASLSTKSGCQFLPTQTQRKV